MATSKIPSIVDGVIEILQDPDYGFFKYKATSIKRSDLFLNVPAATAEHSIGVSDGAERGWVAARNAFEKTWEVVDVVAHMIRSLPDTVLIFNLSGGHYDKLALGVDSRMRPEDVNGATIIKKNKSGTKWVFAHATEAEHHNRMLSAEAAMSTVFDALVQNSLSRVLTLVVHNRPSNQQLGALTVWEHITDFRHDCMRMARWHEGELDIGAHIKDPDNHDIYDMLQKAFATAEKKWQIEKSAALNQISDHIAPIKKRLASRHSFKHRWERPTVFPNAQQSDASEESGE